MLKPASVSAVLAWLKPMTTRAALKMKEAT